MNEESHELTISYANWDQRNRKRGEPERRLSIEKKLVGLDLSGKRLW